LSTRPSTPPLQALYAAGFSFRLNGDGKLYLRPAERVGGALLTYLKQHKEELVAGLTYTKSIRVGDGTFPYIPRWAGQVLAPADGYLSYDVETNLVDLSREIPQIALASASTNELACLVHPDDLGRFILVHHHLRWLGQSVSFDFWATAQHLQQRGDQEALAAWWQIADEGRLHDTMLLDMLLRLARDDSYPNPRGLDKIADEYADLAVDKNDPYRKRYGELLGMDWATVTDEGFWEYAVADAVVTKLAYTEIKWQVEHLLADFPGKSEILPDATAKYGLLTETLQVRKSIALSQIQRNGLAIDPDWVCREEHTLRNRLAEVTAVTAELCPGLYNVREDGSWEKTKTGGPKKNLEPLRQKLAGIATAITNAEDNDLTVYVPHTKKSGEVSTTLTFWRELADYDATGFLKYWVEVEELAKLVQFFGKLQGERVHSKYTVMVRSGRTSCSSPNVQQIPKRFTFRQAFIAALGAFLLTVDYSFI
jgi:hypothetical protein